MGLLAAVSASTHKVDLQPSPIYSPVVAAEAFPAGEADYRNQMSHRPNSPCVRGNLQLSLTQGTVLGCDRKAAETAPRLPMKY